MIKANQKNPRVARTSADLDRYLLAALGHIDRRRRLPVALGALDRRRENMVILLWAGATLEVVTSSPCSQGRHALLRAAFFTIAKSGSYRPPIYLALPSQSPPKHWYTARPPAKFLEQQEQMGEARWARGGSSSTG
jgi:hypothetical protein